ncbi:DUF6216 family protein [Variovorax sp. GB1R11]|uniref:DUF6216 family protein n=1 Tax=Variovorax sp. GB1R11 TaxID=3443741 RepID=UPI003F45B908
MQPISIPALSELAKLIGVLFPVIALIATVSRTRSTHTFLRYRLWQLVFSPREIDDPVFRQHIDEETVVAAFRTRYNILVDLPAQAHRIIHWAKARNVSVPAIGACGYYFDFKLCEIRKKLPSPRRTKVLAFAVVTLGMLAVVLLAFASGNSVLAQFKESKRYFLVNRDTATPLFPQGPVVTKASCQKGTPPEANPLGFSVADQRFICTAFIDEAESSATAKFLNDGLRAQRWLLGSFLLVVLAAATIFFWTVQELRATYRLQKALAEKADPLPSGDSQNASSASSGLDQESLLPMGHS